MFWSTTETRIKRTVEALLRQVLDDADTTLGKIKTIQHLNAKVKDLREQAETATIEKDRREEEYSRKDREVEHKVGLERTRQKFEVEQAKRETTVHVREENLEADKERFKGEIEFQRKHLEGEIGSLRELVQGMLKRLPSAEIFAKVKTDG